jgi:murein DD-endopeptidase MepM/ murein hydrolase activator NlpD
MRATPLALAFALLACATARAELRATIFNRRIQPNQTLAHALHQVPLSGPQVDAIVGALRPVFDFRRSRPGDQLRVVLRHGEVDYLDYRQGPLDEWQVRRDGERLVASKRAVEYETRAQLVDLEIESSLYEAAIAAGETPEIAMVLSDVFAWDIDFYQDVRRGDRARAVVEKVLSKGRLVRYGEVLAASYEGQSVGQKRVYRYQLPSGERSYFQADGSSARKSFLKSPLKYAHVTSRFGSRLHPVLKYLKDHNGVDYGAAIGTPVWAVADGTVTHAGYAGANGNLVCLRHSNGFETCYAHLSKINVRPGGRVSQKQVIALTGNTGRSTGPHLHYALKRNGRYVNPLNQHFPRADPLPRQLVAAFQEAISPWASQLDATAVATSAISRAAQ